MRLPSHLQKVKARCIARAQAAHPTLRFLCSPEDLFSRRDSQATKSFVLHVARVARAKQFEPSSFSS
jgi:hypothetical protein